MSNASALFSIVARRLSLEGSARFPYHVEKQARERVKGALTEFFTLILHILSLYMDDPDTLLIVIARLKAAIEEVQKDLPPEARSAEWGDPTGGGEPGGPT